MVAIKSTLLFAVGLLSLGVSAMDDRELAYIPTKSSMSATCKRFESHCTAYVKELEHGKIPAHNVHTYCQKGSQIGRKKNEVAVVCSYVKGDKNWNMTTKVIANAGLTKVL